MLDLGMVLVGWIAGLIVGSLSAAVVVAKLIERPNYKARWQAASQLIARLDQENRNLAVGLADDRERTRNKATADMLLKRTPKPLGAVPINSRPALSPSDYDRMRVIARQHRKYRKGLGF
jgi:hypothetical protein